MFVAVMVTFIGGVAAQGSPPLTEAMLAMPSAVYPTEAPVQAIGIHDVREVSAAEPQYGVKAAESHVVATALPLAEGQLGPLEAQPAILLAPGQEQHAESALPAMAQGLPLALGSEVQGEPLVPGPMLIVDPLCAFDGSGCVESTE